MRALGATGWMSSPYLISNRACEQIVGAVAPTNSERNESIPALGCAGGWARHRNAVS